MRAQPLSVLLCVACMGGVHQRATVDAGPTPLGHDAQIADAPMAMTATDGGVIAPPPPPPPPPPPTADAGPTCTPTRTACAGELECGHVPDGCAGSYVDCGDCGGGINYCIREDASAFATRIYNCIQAAASDHPDWVDADHVVADAYAPDYMSYVLGCCDGDGRVCIIDSNAPLNEIRVRATDADIADNFIVRTYGGSRSAARYTSSCTPALF